MTSGTHVVCYVYDNNSEQRFVNDGTEWFFFLSFLWRGKWSHQLHGEQLAPKHCIAQSAQVQVR